MPEADPGPMAELSQPEPMAEAEAESEPEPLSSGQPEPEPMDRDSSFVAGEAPEPVTMPPPGVPPQPDDEGVIVSESAPFPRAAQVDVGPSPGAPTDAPRAEEEELMWLGDEFEEADLEVASGAWREAVEPNRTPPQSTQTELSDDQLAQLARDEGWPPDELSAIRSFLGRPMAVSLSKRDEPPPPAPPSIVQAPPTRTLAPGDPDWLRGRRGPAATAYRRLRRLLP